MMGLNLFETFFLSEICLTSNVKCYTVKSYDDHHFKDWQKNNHPIVICVSFIIYMLMSVFIGLAVQKLGLA